MADPTETWDDISTEVTAAGGVLTTNMMRLRKINNPNGRLGVNVCAEISKKLASVGLGHYPAPLPTYQDQHARLFRLGSAIADIHDAVVYLDQESDQKLLEVSGGVSIASQTVEAMREILARHDAGEQAA